MQKNKRVVYDNRGRYATVPIDYIKALQMNNQRDKAKAYLEYYLDMHEDNVNSIRFYAVAWGVSKSTASNWIDEFKIEIEKYHTFWTLKNATHHTSVSKKSGLNVDTLGNESGHENNYQSTENTESVKSKMDSEKNETGQQVDKDSNTSNIHNINADSNESANNNPSSKTNSYSANFEILWNRYDKKTSNKARSQKIYIRRWKNTDIKILIEAIDKYKSAIDLTYLKDFDGFLNGVIDTYIPRRAWIVDRNKNKHFGWFYDNENKFVSDALKILTIESNDIAEYIDSKRFGYVA